MLLKLLPDILDKLDIFILEIEELEVPQVSNFYSYKILPEFQGPSLRTSSKQYC